MIHFNIPSHVRLYDVNKPLCVSLNALSALNDDAVMSGGGEEGNKEDSSSSNLPRQLLKTVNKRHDRDRDRPLIVYYFNYASLHHVWRGLAAYPIEMRICRRLMH